MVLLAWGTGSGHLQRGLQVSFSFGILSLETKNMVDSFTSLSSCENMSLEACSMPRKAITYLHGFRTEEACYLPSGVGRMIARDFYVRNLPPLNVMRSLRS